MKISHAVGGIIIPDDMNCRFGKFKVDKFIIDDQPLLTMRLFRHVIVVRCECDYASLMLEYTAMSPYFDPIPKGTHAPYYCPIFTKENGQITKIEWAKAIIPPYEP